MPVSHESSPYIYNAGIQVDGSDDDGLTQFRLGSPGLDSPRKIRSSSPTKSVTAIKTEVPASRATASKRKSYHDQLRESGEFERASRERIAAIQTKGKTERQEIKESKRRKLAIEVEDLRGRNAREENLAMRAHEIAMMDRKLELARLQQSPMPQQQYRHQHDMTQSRGYPSASNDFSDFDYTSLNNSFAGPSSNSQHGTTPSLYDEYATDSPNTATASTRSSTAL